MKRFFALLLALVMAVSLCACGKSNNAPSPAESTEPPVEEVVTPSPEEEAYNAALALMEEEKWEEAIAAFTALGTYEDSQAKAEECQTRLTEAKYAEACALMEEEKYVEAAEILRDLDYLDSAEKFEECRQNAPYELTEVGDIITFGKYEQDRVKENGADPLTWRVLDKQDGRMLILTEKLIDELPFHAIYWKHSSINGFLNGSFLNDFTPEEKDMILKTMVEPHPHPDAPDIDQGSAFEEKVFLLSLDEVKKYLPDPEDRISVLTAYTIWFGDFDKEPGDAYPWWLRTAYWNGPVGATIAAVDAKGLITAYSHRTNCGLRPACWIQFETAD